jgi:hypothetical protein
MKDNAEPKRVAGPEIIEGFSLRIPVQLRERIRQRAIANRRSLSAEMLVLMETALPKEQDAKQGEAA